MELTKEMENAVNQIKKAKSLKEEIQSVKHLVDVARSNDNKNFSKMVLDFAEKYYNKYLGSDYCFSKEYSEDFDDLYWSIDYLRMMICGI